MPSRRLLHHVSVAKNQLQSEHCQIGTISCTNEEIFLESRTQHLGQKGLMELTTAWTAFKRILARQKFSVKLLNYIIKISIYNYTQLIYFNVVSMQISTQYTYFKIAILVYLRELYFEGNSTTFEEKVLYSLHHPYFFTLINKIERGLSRAHHIVTSKLS